MTGATLAKPREYGKRGSERSYGNARSCGWFYVPSRTGYNWILRMLPFV